MFFNGRKFFMSNSSTKRAIAIASAIIIAFIGGYLLGATNGIALNISVNHNGTIADKQQTVMPASVSFATTAQATAAPTAETPVTEAPTTKPATSVTPTTEMPTTEAPIDALTLYNQAAAAASFASANYSATMTDIVFSSSLIERFFDKNEAMNTCTVADASAPGTLTQITAADCASAEMTDNGTQYTVTLKLNAVELSISAVPPQNGYPFFMDAAAVEAQVSKVNDKLEYKNDGSIALSDGTLTAVIDKATGRMTSVTLTLTEVCKDGISMGSIGNLLGLSSLTGEFHYDITVQYK